MPGPRWGTASAPSAGDFLGTSLPGWHSQSPGSRKWPCWGGRVRLGARPEPNCRRGGVGLRTEGCCLKLFPGPTLTPSFPRPKVTVVTIPRHQDGGHWVKTPWTPCWCFLGQRGCAG